MSAFHIPDSGQPAEAPAESLKQRQVRLLQLLADADAPLSTDGSWQTYDLEVLAGLITNGLAAGEIVRLEGGQINGLHGITLKPAGRARLAEAAGRKPVSPRTGLIRHNPFSIYLWLLAIVAVLYLAYCHFCAR